jgi:hypothetical protein
MTRLLVRSLAAAALCGALFTACGEGGDDVAKLPPANDRAAAERPKAPAFMVFRRVRYEGATMRILTLRTDGSMSIDIPNGGAGGSFFTGELKPAALRSLRRLVDETPWDRLSRRKAALDQSGAYFMLHRKGKDYIGMASGMSRDLLPVVRRLNEVFVGEGVAHKELDRRFYTP